jgi:predicted N-formylglutamate amidohydrolase
MVGLVLTCEHASFRLPPGEDLGVADEVLRSHAGWDPGAYDIAARVGEALGLAVHAGAFSRLYVDLDRPADHPDVVPVTSFGARVPGNLGLPADERARRVAVFHAPYWASVRRDVAARVLDRGRCLHLTSHTFDPRLAPEHRAFDIGVLYDPARPFEAALAEQLQFGMRAAGFTVRANQPYRGTEPGITASMRLEQPATAYAGIEIETSQSLARQPGATARVAATLAELVPRLLEVEA